MHGNKHTRSSRFNYSSNLSSLRALLCIYIYISMVSPYVPIETDSSKTYYFFIYIFHFFFFFISFNVFLFISASLPLQTASKVINFICISFRRVFHFETPGSKRCTDNHKMSSLHTTETKNKRNETKIKSAKGQIVTLSIRRKLRWQNKWSSPLTSPSSSSSSSENFFPNFKYSFYLSVIRVEFNSGEPINIPL